MSVFQNMVNKHIDVDFMKNHTYYKDDFKSLLRSVFNYAFYLDELYIYRDRDGANLFNKIWQSVKDKDKISNIIRNEENILYKKTMNLYLNHPLSRNWIDEIYANGRKYNISTISSDDVKEIEAAIRYFGGLLNTNKNAIRRFGEDKTMYYR